jgi:hypothetical protein
MAEMPDEFLSEDDLNLRELSDEEFEKWWNEWLHLAQQTNDEDRDTYSHGVFVLMREPR